MEVIWEYSVFIFLIAFLFYLCIANKFADIAAMKGHESGYWGWCFFFGPIGWLMVIALPDLYARNPIKNEDKTSTDKPVLPPEPEAPQLSEPVVSETDNNKTEEAREPKEHEADPDNEKSLSAREALLLRVLIYIVLAIAACYAFVKLY